MTSPSKRVLFTHTAVALIGIVVGAALAHWTEVQLWHNRALAAYGMAIKLDSAGRLDEATILLSQAIVANPDNYAPLSLLGDIYSRKGNYTLALALYKKALLVANIQNNISRTERDAIRKDIEATKKQLGMKVGPR